MRRRREAPLPRALHGAPPVVEVEAQSGRIALALRERRLARDHESDSRHALEAFVGGGRQRVEPDFPRIDRQSSECAHRVDQQPAAVLGDHRRDLRHGIEDPRRRLALDDRHMGDGGILGEAPGHFRWRRRRVLGRLIDRVGAPAIAAHLHHAPAIGAIREDQELARVRHEATEHRLHGEGAAALKRYRDMRSNPARQGHQLLAHMAVERG